MRPDARFRDLVLRYSADPDWLPSVSRDITDAIHAELPALDADPELRNGTYASTEGVLRLLVYMVRNEVPPRDAEPPPAGVDYAREFVREGLPLDSLLRAYHVGQATFFRRWAEAVRREAHDGDAQANAIELGADWTFEFIKALSAGLVRRYAEERERWVRSAAAVRSQAVESLLADEPVDVQAMSGRLRYELDRDHLAFVVWHDAPEETGEESLATLERAAVELTAAVADGRPLIVPRARLVIAAWVTPDRSSAPEPAPLRLDVREFPSVFAAFGSVGGGVTGFCRSHHEAMHARRIARLTRRRPGSVTGWNDVALAAVASADLELAQQFVASELGPLVGDDDQTTRLAATLRVYLEEQMSPRRAAQRLGVHENTIANRIRAVREQLGHPIEDRACELQVALRLVAIAREPV